MPTRVYAPVSEGYTTSAIGREKIMSIQAPVPDFGAIKCPDCDTIMKPVTLSEEGELEQAARLLECPKCGRRLTQARG
jgi:DNA-directed RNA polymerase subunit RPC12/RpoP